MFAISVWLVLWAWFGDDARRKIREYLPPPCRQYSGGHFEGKLELLDGIGMPLAPKGNQGLRQPPPQDPDPVHAGMAAGAERHQLGVVAGLAVMNVSIMLGLAAAASPAVAIESRLPVASEEKRRIPQTPVTAHAQPGDRRRRMPAGAKQD